MFDYLEKFNKLPKEIRDRVSTPTIMNAIDELERKYDLELAIIIMKVMVKDIKADELDLFLSSHHGLSQDDARRLQSELHAKVFADVMDYLHIRREVQLKQQKQEPEMPQVNSQSITPKNSFPDDVNDDKLASILLESKIRFSSLFLQERFKNIMRTCLRGVRSTVDTKLTLIKPFENGGLGFDKSLADRVIQIAEKYKMTDQQTLPKQSPIDRHIAREEKTGQIKPDFTKIIPTRDIDYDLASVLAERLKKEKEERSIQNIDQRPKAQIRVAEPRKETSPQIKKNIETSAPIRPINLDIDHELAPPTPNMVPVPEKMIASSTPDKDKKASLLKFSLFSRDKNDIQSKPVSAKDTTETKMESIQKPIGNIIKPEQKKVVETKNISDIVPDMINKMQPRIVKDNPRETGQTATKIKIEDVRTSPKIMGPVEELRYMDLVNFRRLGQSAEQRTKKIEEKLNILEDEAYGKRVEGIQAWRKSPVYRLYLDIGQAAISENRQISAIINDRQKSNQDFLDMEEIISIANLNNRIRF